MNRPHRSFQLRRHADPIAVVRLAPDAEVPTWATGSFTSVTRTPSELSITCAADAVPTGADAPRLVEGPWRALEVVGPLDFALVGVLAELSLLLADAEVSIFVISTYDTDWLLVPSADLGKAEWALTAGGHIVEA